LEEEGPVKEDRDMDSRMGTSIEIPGRGSEEGDHPGDLGTGLDSETGSGVPNEKMGFWEAYQKFRREHDLVELNIDPDEIWGDVRDQSPGRDFEW
jgi:hypothetical protein